MPHIAKWQILDQAVAVRKRLLRAGFLPIPATGKKILVDNWSDIIATEGEIDTWFSRYPDATNTGVLTRTTPAIDLDVYDPDVAAELETLLFDMIGTRAAVRFGQPPKRAILFRTDKSFKKIVTQLSFRQHKKLIESKCWEMVSKSSSMASIRKPA